MKNLVFKASSEFNGFVGKDCELFWSTGVLEYWARKNYLESLLHHSIIPLKK